MARDVGLRGLGGASTALVVSSLGFAIVGALRMKFAATGFGPSFVAVLAQASTVQLLALTVLTSGAMTVARLELSDIQVALTQRHNLAGQLLRSVTFRSSIAVVPLLLFGAPLSKAILGGEHHGLVLQFACFGIPFQSLAVAILLVTQTLGTQAELMRSAVTGAGLSLLGVGLSMQGSESWAAASFVVAPIAQCLGYVLSSETARRLVREAFVRRRHQQMRLARQVGHTVMIATVVQLAVDVLLRADVAKQRGLGELGLWQPSMLFAVQGFSLLTGSLTQVVTTAVMQLDDRESPIYRVGPWTLALQIGAAQASIAVGIFVASPLLIPIFLSEALKAGTPTLALALVAEPLRAVGWISGASVLPQGRLRLWGVFQVLGVSAQVSTTVLLINSQGVMALAWGVIAATTVSIVSHLVVLKPTLRSPDIACVAWLLVCIVTLIDMRSRPLGALPLIVAVSGVVVVVAVLRAPLWRNSKVTEPSG